MDYKFKICFAGASGSGKSSIISRRFKEEFNTGKRPTIGFEYHSFKLLCNECKISFDIWDTAGQERYKSIAKNYFRNAVACILVFDITDISSFNEINCWLNQFHQSSHPNSIVILVGNKNDLEEFRQVSQEDMTNFAENHYCKYIETSALNGNNIEELFHVLAFNLIQNAKEGKFEPASSLNLQLISKKNSENYKEPCCKN